MVEIVQINDKNKVLRGVAKEIPLTEIGGEKIKKLIKEMSGALNETKDGVALAAPQIGVPFRIFIVYKIYMETKPPESAEKPAGKNEKEPENKNMEIAVFINPKITRLSKKKQIVREGCLSVTGIFGTTTRSEKVTLEVYDEKGQKITRGASGLFAQIIQHEMDHLNGILFIDTATDLEKIEK